jgi:hypothetical protein
MDTALKRLKWKQCRKCGQTEGKIDLHHIVPQSFHKGFKKKLWQRNIESLCHECHNQWHIYIDQKIRSYIRRLFQEWLIRPKNKTKKTASTANTNSKTTANHHATPATGN